MREEVKLWLDQALDDLDTAKYNLNGKKLNAVALYTQQAVEKALKALFIKKANELPKVHDLVFLAKKLDIPEKFFQYCKELSPYYMQTRYQDAVGFKKSDDFSYDEIASAVKKAEEIIKWAEKQI